jgi:hypothetical protein
MSEKYEGALPINAHMGWTEGLENKNDAIELAKGYITRRFNAVESSWYSVAPLLEGYLWEVHEGGQGKGYIEGVMDALAENPGATIWFPSGTRAFQFMMRDGKPFGVLLPQDESEVVKRGDVAPILPRTRMKRAVNRGTGVMVAGATLFGASVVSMVASIVFYSFIGVAPPTYKEVSLPTLPHAQWRLVGNVPATEIISKLEFKDGRWSTDSRPHKIPDFDKLDQEVKETPKTAIPASTNPGDAE